MMKLNLLARTHIYSVVYFFFAVSLNRKVESMEFVKQIIWMKYHTKRVWYCGIYFSLFPFLLTAAFILTLLFQMMANVSGLVGQLPNGRQTSDVKSGYNLSVTFSIYAGPLFKACNRDYWIASRQSSPSIISPTTMGSAQRAALPQELNLIKNLGRKQILLLLSYAPSKRRVSILGLA